MTNSSTRISIKGRQVEVPLIQAGGYDVVVTGRWLKIAAVKSEDYVERDPAPNADQVIAELKTRSHRPDVFSFVQRIGSISPRYQYPMAWDSVAALSTTSYRAWWDALSQETRRNVRLAEKRGLVLRTVHFGEALVNGIAAIYNETPHRQGRRFWHYGKQIDTIRSENGTYLDRSEFIGAYLNGKLIGFLKFVRVEQMGSIMQILAMNAHRDRKPMNALVAKAVEVACERSLTHVIYCKYVYHRRDALTEFKRRMGFREVLVPRYFVPLTVKGRLAVRLNLQRGLLQLMPQRLKSVLLFLRHFYTDCAGGVRAAAKRRVAT